MPASVTLSDGTVVTPSVDPDIVPNVIHNVGAQVRAIDGGKMDGWQQIPGCGPATSPPYACISGYQPSQIPNITALAQDFAISDRTFSLQASASWGGHLAVVAAAQDRFLGGIPTHLVGGPPSALDDWGCASNKVARWLPPGATKTVLEPSCIPDYSLGLPNGGAFEPTPVQHIPTLMDELDQAGLPWRIYGALHGEGGYTWSICPSFADCLYTGQDANLVPSNQFTADAQAGNLPAFSVVTPGGATFPDGCHNNMSMTACDDWVGQVASAVMTGPEWSSTALFITWDDCGCFYDQVPPGVNPDGTGQGPRVPLIIVSPWANLGFTDTAPTTFAGIAAFVERTFGLAPLGANDGSAYDFSNAFNFSQAPLRPVHMVARPLPPRARHIHLTPAMLNDPT